MALQESLLGLLQSMRVCQNTLLITEDRYIAELSYEVAI